MRNHQQSDKPARNRKSRQLSGGEFQDEDRDSGRSSNSRGTTDNRPHKNRIGDHICYISDLSKLKSHYPDWSITKSLPQICEEIVAAQDGKATTA